MKILLLEDDEVLSNTLVRFLTKEGYSVDLAKDGEEAIDLSFEHSYSLYLFDINVPKLNGIDLLKELRDANDFTPAILLSALVDIDSITKGFIAGADDYIKKPFDPDELLVRVKAKTNSIKEYIEVAGYSLDLKKNKLFKDGEEIVLSATLKRLFSKLAVNYPNITPTDELLLVQQSSQHLILQVTHL